MPTLHAVCLFNLGSPVVGALVRVEENGRVRSGLGQTVRDGEADASSGSGHDGGLALEREERQDLVGVGRAGVVFAEDAILHRAV